MTEESVTGVQLDDGSSHEADLVLVCAGIKPNAELAGDAGLEVANGVVVDDEMRTSDSHVLAAGDFAEHAGRIYGVWPAAVAKA
jgi:NAD(P)H-nitrite reductase large subunit